MPWDILESDRNAVQQPPAAVVSLRSIGSPIVSREHQILPASIQNCSTELVFKNRKTIEKCIIGFFLQRSLYGERWFILLTKTSQINKSKTKIYLCDQLIIYSTIDLHCRYFQCKRFTTVITFTYVSRVFQKSTNFCYCYIRKCGYLQVQKE